MIISTTIVLALEAAHTGRHAASMAVEVESANRLLSYLVDASPPEPSVAKGRSADFDWTLEVVPLQGEQMVAGRGCRVNAGLRAINGGRRYRLESARVCGPAKSQ